MNDNDFAALGGHMPPGMLSGKDFGDIHIEDDAKMLNSCIEDLVSPGDASLEMGLDGFDFNCLDFGLMPGPGGREHGLASPSMAMQHHNGLGRGPAGNDHSGLAGTPGGHSMQGGDANPTAADRSTSASGISAATAAQQRSFQVHQQQQQQMAAALGSQHGLFGDGDELLGSLGMDALDPSGLLGEAEAMGLHGHHHQLMGQGGLGHHMASLGARFGGVGSNAAMAGAAMQQKRARLLSLQRAQSEHRARLAAAANGMLGGGGGFRMGGLLDDPEDLMDEQLLLSSGAQMGLSMSPSMRQHAMGAAAAAQGFKNLQQQRAGLAPGASAAFQRHLLRSNLMARQSMMLNAAAANARAPLGLQRRTSAPSLRHGHGSGNFNDYQFAGAGGGAFGRSLSSAGGLELAGAEEGAQLSCKTAPGGGGLDDVTSLTAEDVHTATAPQHRGEQQYQAAAAAAAAVAMQGVQQTAAEHRVAQAEVAAAAAAMVGLEQEAAAEAAAAPAARLAGEPSSGSKRKAASTRTSSRASGGSDAQGEEGEEGEEEQGYSAPNNDGSRNANDGPVTKRKKKSQNEKIEELRGQVAELRDQNQQLKKKAGKLASDKSKILTCLTNLSMLVGQKKVENEMLKSKIAQLQEVVCGEPEPMKLQGLKGVQGSPASQQSQQMRAQQMQQMLDSVMQYPQADELR